MRASRLVCQIEISSITIKQDRAVIESACVLKLKLGECQHKHKSAGQGALVDLQQCQSGATEDLTDPTSAWYTNQHLANRVIQDYPRLLEHSCVNDAGNTFAHVIGHTPLLHLLEHLIVDIQCQQDPKTCYLGFTDYVKQDYSRAQITLSYTDDLQLLRSIKFAQQYLNSLLQRI